MPDYSTTTANIPEASPRTLVPSKTKDDATDRDAANPTEVAGAHAEAAVNEIVALYREAFPDALGRVYDAGGLNVTVGAGRLVKADGSVVSWAKDAELALTDDDTNYIEVSAAGVVSANVAGFSGGSVPLAEVLTAGGDISSVTDKRAAFQVPVKCNFAATAAPTADEDSGDGYAVGSLWHDTTADKSYVCLDATATAAVWHRTDKPDSEIDHGGLAGLGDDDHTQYMKESVYDSGVDGKVNPAAGGTGLDTSGATGFPHVAAGTWSAIKSNLAAAVAPTADEDSGDGYSVGSLWLDTTADKSYICLDATESAAVWHQLDNTDADTVDTQHAASLRHKLDLSVAAEGGDEIVVTLQLQDLNGNNLTDASLAHVWLSDSATGAECSTAPNADAVWSTGTQLEEITADKRWTVLTDAGVAALTIGDSGTPTFYLRAELDGKVYTSAAITFA